MPERHVALLVSDSHVRSRDPGDYILSNWPVPAPEAILVDLQPLSCDVPVDALRSGDEELVTLTLQFSVKVVDAVHMYDTCLQNGPGPAWYVPVDRIAGRLHSVIEEQVKHYAASDLNRPSVVQTIRLEVREPLKAELDRYGLILAVPTIAIHCVSQTVRKQSLLAAKAARDLARDERMQSVLSLLESRDMFLDQIKTWQESTGEKLDEQTIEMLWQHVEPNGLPLRNGASVSKILGERAMILEREALGKALPAKRRLDQAVVRLGASNEIAPATPSHRLERLYESLRLLAAVGSTGWALHGALTNGLDHRTIGDLTVNVAGLLVAAIGLVAAWATFRRAQRQAAPYWTMVEEQAFQSPVGSSLTKARTSSRLMNLMADLLIGAGLVISFLLIWIAAASIAFAIPASLFIVAILLTLIAHGHERQAHSQADEILRRVEGLRLRERRAEATLVSRRTREYLSRVETNLTGAGRNLFELGAEGQKGAVRLRKLAAEKLRELQREADSIYQKDAQFFSARSLTEDQLTQVLDLDESLLNRSQAVALQSERLYAASTDGNTSDVASLTSQLDKDLNKLRRVLGERAALIGDPG